VIGFSAAARAPGELSAIRVPARHLLVARSSMSGAMRQHFASLLMAFSDAFQLANQLSLWAAIASVAVRIAFLLASGMSFPGVSRRKSNDERS